MEASGLMEPPADRASLIEALRA